LISKTPPPFASALSGYTTRLTKRTANFTTSLFFFA